MPLNIDDLRCFILVANERSVSRAAKKLGVTQQSASERIRRFEGRLGVKLFDRLSHGMAPSSSGYRLLPYATQSLALLDHAFSVIGDDDLVRVALQRNVANAVRPLLGPLTDDAFIRVDLTDDSTDDIVDALLANEIDAAIGVFNNLDHPRKAQPDRKRRQRGSERASEPEDEAPPTGDEPDFQPVKVVAEHLFSDPMVWAVPPGHPLADDDQPLPVAELIPLAVGNEGSNDVAARSDLQGVRIGPLSTLDSEITDGRLVELSVDAPGWVMPISIAYRSTETDRQGIVTLTNTLRDKHSSTPANDSTSPANGRRP